MAILNKKSMLFLLATILLICSSYADDDLSSAGMEERGLANSLINFAQELKLSTLISTRDAKKYSSRLWSDDYSKRIKKIIETGKDVYDVYDVLGQECTKEYCNYNGYSCGAAVCLERRAKNEKINCDKDCR